MTKQINDYGANLLAVAIVENAIKDYEYGLKYKDSKPKTQSQASRKFLAKKLYNDCRKFFRSEWYKQLCSIDGEALIKRIEEHYNEYKCSILSDEKTKEKKKRKVPLKEIV